MMKDVIKYALIRILNKFVSMFGPELGASIIMVGLLATVIGSITFASGYMTCKSYENNTQRQTKYSYITGCYVKTNNGWIPKEELMNRAITNEK